jgi:mono/diheme cytochrome c family protein
MRHRKPDVWEKARELRAEGQTLRAIANELGIALSTASLWVRDVRPAQPRKRLEPVAAVDAQEAASYRRCGRCHRDLPLASFNRHRDGHQWWCRECYATYFRSKGQLHRDQSRSARTRRRKEARRFVDEYAADRHCSDCGESDAAVLEFDHLRGKRGNVADLIRAGASVRRLERELANCDVVCANCHRIRTATRAGSWRLDPGDIDRNAALTHAERRNLMFVRDVLIRASCVDCGDSRIVVLEFDHLGAKRGNVVELARRGCSLRLLETEIATCEIRCVNCHRRRTMRSKK